MGFNSGFKGLMHIVRVTYIAMHAISSVLIH